MTFFLFVSTHFALRVLFNVMRMNGVLKDFVTGGVHLLGMKILQNPIIWIIHWCCFRFKGGNFILFFPNFVMVCIGILMSGNLVFVGGKSAILTALCVAFGCRAKGTQRAATLKDFIKTGCRFVQLCSFLLYG